MCAIIRVGRSCKLIYQKRWRWQTPSIRPIQLRKLVTTVSAAPAEVLGELHWIDYLWSGSVLWNISNSTVNHWICRRNDYKGEVNSNDCNSITITIQQRTSEEKKDADEERGDEEKRLFIASPAFCSRKFTAVEQLFRWCSMKVPVLFYYLKKKSMLKQVQNEKKEGIITVRSLMSEVKMRCTSEYNTKSPSAEFLEVEDKGAVRRTDSRNIHRHQYFKQDVKICSNAYQYLVI